MKYIVLGIVAMSLVACGTSKEESAEVVVEETVAPVAEEIAILEEEIPQQRAVYRPAETILTDLVHTRLEVNFVWEKSEMNGIATITAKPHFYASDSLILDAKAMIINAVSMDGKPLKYVYTNDFLRIQLDKEYKRGEEYTVVVDYVARPESREAGGSAAITSDKGLYFINPLREEGGKMPQIWTQGETEASSVWFPTIDAPNAKTSQEIFITVEDKYATLSNGKLMSSKQLAGGKRVDHWKQELPHAPYLFMMGIGEFKIVKDSYTRPDGSAMEVNYYVEPEWEQYAKDIFGETPEMIRFFSDKLGVEYPWDKYHQIVCRDYVSGAMENTGAVIFGDFVYKNKRELLDGNDQSTIAHELFHHWFGDLVTCESWSNLTLNESFANYSQYLWDEHRYGVDEADYYADVEADGYFQSAQMQGYHDLVWFDYDDKEQMFDGHSYNKGGRILHMLRNYLGDEAFFEAIHNYLDQNKFKAAEFHHLRLAFEEVCGEDLNWFFNQWYLGSAHPVLKFTQEIDEEKGEIMITVEQEQDLEIAPIFKLPVNMVIFDDNGKHVHKVVIDELTEEFSFSFTGEVKGILYDEQQMLLAKTNKQKSTEQYIFQYYNGERYMARRDGLMKGSRDRGEAGQKLILDALKDPFWHIRQLAVKKVPKLRDANKDAGIALLENMAMNDPKSSVRAAALNALSKYKSDDELAKVYTSSIEKDQSYFVVTSALKAFGKLDAEKAMTLAEGLEKESSSSMVAGIVQLYASNGAVEKYDYLEEALTGNVVQGFDKLGVMNSFTVFVAGQEPDVAMKALNAYREVSKTGGFYMQMFLPQNVNYLVENFDKKIKELKKEIEVFEENDQVAYADQARKKIEAYGNAMSGYNELIKELEE